MRFRLVLVEKAKASYGVVIDKKTMKKETGLEPPRPPVFKKVVGMPIYKPKPSQMRIVPREDGQKRAARAARRARA